MHRIAIKIEGIERRKKSTGLLHIVAGFFLMANASGYYKESGYENFFTVLPIYLIAAASLLYGLLRNRIDPAAQFNHWMRMLQFLMFTLLGVLFLKSDIDLRNILLLVWAIICILLLFTERKVFHDAVLNFGQNSITIPGYFSNKVLPWEAIENIVVRQDFVTIYYPQNKYTQYEVQAELNEVQINTINQFCQQRIQLKETMQQV